MSIKYRLAVAAPRFDLPSETFIRAHARQLAPGRTVLLSHLASAELPIDAPLLAPLDHAGVLAKAWRAGSEALGLASEPGLLPPDRDRAAAFLTTHGVKTLLAEYGWLGAELVGAARVAGVELYVHFHGYDATRLPRSRRWRRRYAWLFAASAGVVTPSRYIADHLRGLGCPAEKLFVCPCGIEPDVFRPTIREPGRVLAVGRLTEKKAPHLTLEAFAMLRETAPHARLDLVGDGDLRARCEEVIQRHRLADVVTLHGVQPHAAVAALMSRSALFVQHSVLAADGDMEGLPVSILEAMSAALPVVATRHSGIPEAVADGETGLLVAERDVPGMAKAMAALLTDPARAAAMGEAGRARVLANFTQEHTRRRLVEIMGLETAHPQRPEPAAQPI
ncbi:glycosyltransferase [Rubrimonas sp.]|uniref:glycosyltransferase n=1 Tax=Rubrimonas sp. TaxID=2036015 RepID=UPI002FDDE88C